MCLLGVMPLVVACVLIIAHYEVHRAAHLSFNSGAYHGLHMLVVVLAQTWSESADGVWDQRKNFQDSVQHVWCHL